MFVMLSIATGLAITASIRTATKNPDVSFNRKGNPAPWEEYKDKQYKVGEKFRYLKNSSEID